MMAQERNDLKAGVFIVASVALIIALIVGIKGLGRIIEPQQTRMARFKLTDNVGGLRVGDDVRVGGLKMGVVKDIDFIMNESGQSIEVTFSLPRRVTLREGARVTIESTVTGASNLNVDDLGSGNPLPENAVLAGRQSGLNALFADAPAIAATIKETTVPKINNAIDNADGLITDIRAKVEPAYQKYSNVADRGTEALTEVRDVFGESKADFKTTIANLAATTGSIKEKIGPILDKLDGGLAKAQASLDDIKAIAENARDITGNIRQILNNNRSRIDAMIASLKTVGDNLKGATAEIRRSPWRLLYKPGPGDMANLNLFDSAREFAEGANDLNDAATALRDALRNPNVDPAQIQRLMEALDRSFTKFTSVEAALWKQVRE